MAKRVVSTMFSIQKIQCCLYVIVFMFSIFATEIKAESILGSNFSTAIIKGTSQLYVAILNPVEWYYYKNKERTNITEQQHITPQKDFNENTVINRTVTIAKTNHTISDRWRSRPYVQKHDNILFSLCTLGCDTSQERLNAAYRLGCYVMPYAIFCFNYTGNEWDLVATHLDACSSIVYGFSWFINIPQKLINKIAYICKTDTPITIFALFDILTNIIMLCIDACLCVVGTILGFILGAILHPIDSLCSFFGMFYMFFCAIYTAVVDCITGLYSLAIFWNKQS